MKFTETQGMLLAATLLLGLPPAGEAWLRLVAAPVFTKEAIWALSALPPEATVGWRP